MEYIRFSFKREMYSFFKQAAHPTSTMEALALWEAAIMASFCSSQSIFIGGDAQALIN